MQHHAQEVEILILGNSHGLYGLRPDVFKRKAYNLCNVSQIFEYDEYLLKRYLPKCKSLTDVVLVVDNSNLFDMPLENTEEFRCIYYRLYMDYPKHSRWSKYGFELSNIQALKEKIQHRNDTCSDLGWNGNYTLERKSLANVPSWMSLRIVFSSFQRLPRAARSACLSASSFSIFSLFSDVPSRFTASRSISS